MPYELVRDAIESLLQVEERHVDRLVFLSMFLQEEASRVDGVRRPAALDEATLVQRDADDLPKSDVDDPFEYFHGMA